VGDLIEAIEAVEARWVCTRSASPTIARNTRRHRAAASQPHGDGGRCHRPGGEHVGAAHARSADPRGAGRRRLLHRQPARLRRLVGDVVGPPVADLALALGSAFAQALGQGPLDWSSTLRTGPTWWRRSSPAVESGLAGAGAPRQATMGPAESAAAAMAATGRPVRCPGPVERWPTGRRLPPWGPVPSPPPSPRTRVAQQA